MGWEYHELPDALRLPKCPHCGNVGRVHQIVSSLFVCLDCSPEHLFRAVWRDARPVALPESRKVASS